MNNKKFNKKLINFIFIIVSTAMLALIIFRSNDLMSIAEALRKIKIEYVTGAVLCLLAFWFLEAYMIYRLLLKYTIKGKSIKTFWLALKTTLIGQYYSNITPGASGGQPVQLYIMKDEDVPLSEGTAVLVEKFLLYQIGVTVYSLILVILKVKSLVGFSNGASIFVLLGLTVNVVMIVSIFLISIKPRVVSYLLEMLSYILHKLHIIKNAEKFNNNVDSFISEYENSIGKMKENTAMTMRLFFLTFVQLTLFFSITFFIYKSLNLSGSSLFEIICLQAFLYMSVCFIPIPGTIGVSEMGFVMLLGNVFSSNIIGTAMLLWRGISYYFSLIFSGIFVILVSVFKSKRIAT